MAGLGAKKQILVVGNDGVQLYVLKGKRVSLFQDLSHAGGDLSSQLKQAFKDAGLPLIVLFDVVEQQYRRENIPKVSFMDKNKVINRKLSMAFPQQQLRAFLISKQKSKDSDGVVALFAGLAPNLTVTQIMDAIIGSEVYIDGAGLLPLESTALVTKLFEEIRKSGKSRKAPARWSVLMTHHKTGGLRQIVVKEGELALTRMTPINVSDPGALSEEFVREFNATLTYLSRFGYVPSDGLELTVVTTPEVGQWMRNAHLPVNELHTLSVAEAGKLLGMETTITIDSAGYGEILHAGWVGLQRGLVVSLSSAVLDKVKQARQFSRIAIFALLLGSVYLGWQMYSLQSSISTLSGDIDVQKTKKISLQNDLDALKKKLDNLQYQPEIIKNVIDVYEDYNSKNIDFQPTIAAMIELMDNSKFKLKEFQASTESKEGQSSPSSPPPPQVINPDGTVAKPPITITMTIEFPETVAIEQAARNTLAFAESLRKRFPGRAISIDKMVGDLSIDKTVKGISEKMNNGKVDGKFVEKNSESTLIYKGALE